MLPLFWTFDLSPVEEPAGLTAFGRGLLRQLLRELRSGEFAQVRLRVSWALAASAELLALAKALQDRGLPFVLTLASGEAEGVDLSGAAPRLAALGRLKRVEVEVPGAEEAEERGEGPLAAARPFVDWGVPVWVVVPFGSELVENLEEVVSGVVEWGAERFLLDRRSPGADDLPDEDEYRQLASRLSTLHQEGWPVQVEGCLPFCHTQSMFRSCGAGIHSCVIRPDGGLYPCRSSPEPLGDLAEAPLRYVWNLPRFGAWAGRRAEACAECPLFASCRSGCRALLEAGKPDPLIQGFKLRMLPSPITRPIAMDETLTVSLRGERARYREGEFLVSDEEHVTAVEPRWSPLLNALQGDGVVLSEVKRRHGEDGLRKVASLYLGGFVRISGTSVGRPAVPAARP